MLITYRSIDNTTNAIICSFAFTPDGETVARLNSDDPIWTSGGEAWVANTRFAEYTLHLGGLRIVLSPEQAVRIVQTLGDHLITCGHRFRIAPAVSGIPEMIVHEDGPGRPSRGSVDL